MELEKFSDALGHKFKKLLYKIKKNLYGNELYIMYENMNMKNLKMPTFSNSSYSIFIHDV